MASRGDGSVPIHSATCSDDASMRRVSILGTPVRAIEMQSAISQIDAWVKTKQNRYICLADVHSVMRARWDKAHNSALQGADLVLPDGMPLVWTGKLRGEKAISRVCGPDLMLELCRHSGSKGWRHFLLGGTDEVLKRLSASLMERTPDLKLCGTFSPPFRQLTTSEDDDLVERTQCGKAGRRLGRAWLPQAGTLDGAARPSNSRRGSHRRRGGIRLSFRSYSPRAALDAGSRFRMGSSPDDRAPSPVAKIPRRRAGVRCACSVGNACGGPRPGLRRRQPRPALTSIRWS